MGSPFYTNDSNIYKHEHVIFKLNNGYYLKYHDVRKFGVMYLVKKDKLFIDTPLKNLGLEPFSNDLTISYLKDKYKSKKTAIKTVLLDQEIITGIGNIYADEILFESKINPLKKANLLNDLECHKIIKNSKEIFKNSIKHGGTTIRSYTSSLGVTGNYQNYLKVHTKKNCPNCNMEITVVKVNGRSTYYCKNCQVNND